MGKLVLIVMQARAYWPKLKPLSHQIALSWPQLDAILALTRGCLGPRAQLTTGEGRHLAQLVRYLGSNSMPS